MEVGAIVKVKIPYKSGERKQGDKFKKGIIEKKYPNFFLIKFEAGYYECYKEKEIIICEGGKDGNR